MFGQILKRGIVAIVMCGVCYPVAVEVYERAAVQRNMINSLDANDAAALKMWPGSVKSFISVLHERCMSGHGRDPGACTRYQLGS